MNPIRLETRCQHLAGAFYLSYCLRNEGPVDILVMAVWQRTYEPFIVDRQRAEHVLDETTLILVKAALPVVGRTVFLPQTPLGIRLQPDSEWRDVLRVPQKVTFSNLHQSEQRVKWKNTGEHVVTCHALRLRLACIPADALEHPPISVRATDGALYEAVRFEDALSHQILLDSDKHDASIHVYAG